MRLAESKLTAKGYVEKDGIMRRPVPAAPGKAAKAVKTPASAPAAVAKAARRKPGPSEPERIMARHLGILKATKLITSFECQPMFWPLADDCKYTVDFRLDCLDGTIFFLETKGPYKREDGIIKFKWMAAEWPCAIFILAERHGSRRLGFRWKFTFRQGRSRIVRKERAQLLKRIGHLLP